VFPYTAPPPPPLTQLFLLLSLLGILQNTLKMTWKYHLNVCPIILFIETSGLKEIFFYIQFRSQFMDKMSHWQWIERYIGGTQANTMLFSFSVEVFPYSAHALYNQNLLIKKSFNIQDETSGMARYPTRDDNFNYGRKVTSFYVWSKCNSFTPVYEGVSRFSRVCRKRWPTSAIIGRTELLRLSPIFKIFLLDNKRFRK